jgi:hypothetical protein
MTFVEVKLKGSSRGYIALSEVAQIEPSMEEVTTKDGRTLKLVSPDSLGQLLGRGLVRGLTEADGEIVTVPVSSLDHVVDRYDEAGCRWVATATTARGVRFLVDGVSRCVLGLDEEVYDIEELREAVARLKGGDPVAEAAVAEAEEAAGRLQRKAG